MALSSIQRLLRQFPPVRALALAQAHKVRRDRANSNWAYNQTILIMIGNMAVGWAGVERMMDELIAHHQQRLTDLSIEHPRSLSRKLDYIKKHLERESTYTWGAKDFFRHLRLEGKRLGSERHEIIHGVLRRSGASVIWRSQRVIYEKANARVQVREFHNDELMGISKQISEFSQYIAPRIWLLIGNNISNDPGSNIEQVHRELLRTHPPIIIP